MILKFLKSILCAGLVTASSAWAVPALQLDIVGGIYDPIQQTTVAQSTVYTLQALLWDQSSLSASGNYFVSASLVPKNGSSLASPGFSSIGFLGGAPTGVSPNDGVYNLSDFGYGTPPVDSLYPNIPGHGFFPGWYMEFAFTFASDPKINAYDVQTNTSASGQLYVHSFTVDTTALLDQVKLSNGVLFDNYDLHFDLYDEVVKYKRSGTTYDTHFAPFSHDAQSWYSTPDGGTTALLVGLGLIGMSVVARRRK